MHKGEKIGRKEGREEVNGDGVRNFLIAFKSLIIASHPVQRHLAGTHLHEHRTRHSQVSPCPP